MNPTFAYAKKNIQIVPSLSIFNTKFQASSLLLGLYMPVCVGPGQNFQRQGFLHCGSNNTFGISSKYDRNFKSFNQGQLHCLFLTIFAVLQSNKIKIKHVVQTHTRVQQSDSEDVFQYKSIFIHFPIRKCQFT